MKFQSPGLVASTFTAKPSLSPVTLKCTSLFCTCEELLGVEMSVILIFEVRYFERL